MMAKRKKSMLDAGEGEREEMREIIEKLQKAGLGRFGTKVLMRKVISPPPYLYVRPVQTHVRGDGIQDPHLRWVTGKGCVTLNNF